MAGAAYIRAVRQALRTTTGTQDFTVTGVADVQGYILCLARVTADGTADHIGWSLGGHDGTNSIVLAAASEDAVADSNTSRRLNSTHVGLLITTDQTGYAVRVKHSSYITGGVRLDVAATDGVAYFAIVYLICGSDAQVNVGSHNLANAVAGTLEDVTSLGFEGTWGLFLAAGGAVDASDPPAAPVATQQVGVALAANSSGPVQRSISYTHDDASASSEPTSFLRNDVLFTDFASVVNLPLTESTSIALDAWRSDGFTLENVLGGNPNPIAWIVVRMGDLRASLNDYLSPTTASGTITVTPGWAPWSLFVLGSTFTAINENAGAQASVLGLGFGDAQSEQFSFGQHEQDSAATMNNGTVCDDTALRLNLGTGLPGLQASSSFNSTQAILTFATVQTTGRQQFILVLEQASFEGTGAGTFPIATGTGAGEQVFSGSGAGSFPLATGTGAGSLVFQGSGAGTFPLPQGTGAGAEVFEGTGAGDFPVPEGTGAGEQVFSGTGAGDFPIPEGTGAGEQVFSGAGAGSFPLAQGAGTGSLVFEAAGAGLFPLALGDGSGEVFGTISGSGAGVFALPLGDGVGALIFSGAGAGLFPLPLGSGVGTSGEDVPFGCESLMEGSYSLASELAGSYDPTTVLDGDYGPTSELDGSVC